MTGDGHTAIGSGSIIPLENVGAVDAQRVGGKAANLGEVQRAGFPVPDGFIVLGDPRALRISPRPSNVWAMGRWRCGHPRSLKIWPRPPSPVSTRRF